jgi:hypothetical protein
MIMSNNFAKLANGGLSSTRKMTAHKRIAHIVLS